MRENEREREKGLAKLKRKLLIVAVLLRLQGDFGVLIRYDTLDTTVPFERRTPATFRNFYDLP